MNISLEKEEIIRQFNLVHDVNLIKAIKSLLAFGLDRQVDDEQADADEIALNKSIDRAISQSNKGQIRPYEEFMAEVKKHRRA